jgi:hypothetical protein
MISALERLRNLRAGKGHEPVNPMVDDRPPYPHQQDQDQRPDRRVSLVPRNPAELSTDWRIDWEERAAILEYDGGLSREEADKRAFAEILNRYGRDP